MNDKELYHYGILGMKWGVRRDQDTLDRLAGRYKEKQSNALERDYKKHIKNVERSTRNAERFKSSKMAEKAKTNRAKVEKAYKIRKKQLKP